MNRHEREHGDGRGRGGSRSTLALYTKLRQETVYLADWLGTVKLNYKVSSPWRLSCQVLPTAPKFSMACHGSGSRSHFPPPSAAQRLSVSSSRSGRCFGITIPCLCQLASPGRPKLTIAAHFSSQHLLRLLQ